MTKFLFPAVAAAAMLTAFQANALLIDDFNDGFTNGLGGLGQVPPLGPLNQPYVNAIGGSRTYEILSGQEFDALFVNPQGELNVTDAGNGPSMHRLTYDANGAGLGGFDLTDAGLSNGISFDIVFIDQGGVTTTVTVEDTSGMTSSLTLPPATGVGINSFFFVDFTGTADFTNVDSVVLNFSLTDASDLRLDFVETIDVPPPAPVPASIALLGISLLGFGLASRRRA